MTVFRSVALASIVFLAGCSSTSSKTKILRDMAIGAGIGAIAAQAKPDNKPAYTSMYAAIGAATVGAASVYFRESDSDKLQEENSKLKVELSSLKEKTEPRLVQKGSSLFRSPIPKEVSSLVEPGEWRRYKMDQWIQDPNQPNTWFRQVEMFEIIPPVSR